jgi:hypothetical protein
MLNLKGLFKLKSLPILMAVLLLSTVFMSACNPNRASLQPSPLTAIEVQAFADPVTENMLQAMNTSDYAQYTRDFDEAFKKNLSPEAFELLNSKRIEAVGKYISKDYWQLVQKNDKLTVAYRTKLREETGTVFVTIYFKSIGGKWYVDGIYYDSFLMHQSGC